jgi:hypothetical protein
MAPRKSGRGPAGVQGSIFTHTHLHAHNLSRTSYPGLCPHAFGLRVPFYSYPHACTPTLMNLVRATMHTCPRFLFVYFFGQQSNPWNPGFGIFGPGHKSRSMGARRLHLTAGAVRHVCWPAWLSVPFSGCYLLLGKQKKVAKTRTHVLVLPSAVDRTRPLSQQEPAFPYPRSIFRTPQPSIV